MEAGDDEEEDEMEEEEDDADADADFAESVDGDGADGKQKGDEHSFPSALVDNSCTALAVPL